MGMKRYDNGLVKVVALLLAIVVPVAALWSWMPDSSKEWLAIVGVVGTFWVAWEACAAPAGEDSKET